MPEFSPIQRGLVLLRRDLKLAARRALWLNPLAFLAIVLSLIAVALKGELAGLELLPAALLWSGLLLSCQLGTESMFQEDFRDGSLEQLLSQPAAVSAVAARLLAPTLIIAGPLCLAAPVLALALGLPTSVLPALAATLPAGTAALILIGSLGSSLALGRGGLLGSVVAIPLTLPVLLFAVGCLDGALAGVAWWPTALKLWLLTALLAAITPLVVARILHLHLE